jgi:hypothetical protein
LATYEIPYDYHRFTPYALEKHFQQEDTPFVKALGVKVLLCQLFCGMTIGA